MYDLTDEPWIQLRDVARLCGPKGKPLALSTVWRWALEGRRAVKLRTWLVGGRRLTKHSAVQEFIAALNPDQSTPAVRSLAQRQKDSECAAKQLERAGI